jgi:hypothetical protein
LKNYLATSFGSTVPDTFRELFVARELLQQVCSRTRQNFFAAFWALGGELLKAHSSDQNFLEAFWRDRINFILARLRRRDESIERPVFTILLVQPNLRHRRLKDGEFCSGEDKKCQALAKSS